MLDPQRPRRTCSAILERLAADGHGRPARHPRPRRRASRATASWCSPRAASRSTATPGGPARATRRCIGACGLELPPLAVLARELARARRRRPAAATRRRRASWRRCGPERSRTSATTYGAGHRVRARGARRRRRCASSPASSRSCSARPARASRRCCGSPPGCSTPTEGTATIDGAPLDAASPRAAAVGLVFQDARGPALRRDRARRRRVRPAQPRARRAEEARSAAARGARGRRARPATRSAERSPFTLSGGEARRAAIAGVLAMRAALPAARRADRRARRRGPRRRARAAARAARARRRRRRHPRRRGVPRRGRPRARARRRAGRRSTGRAAELIADPAPFAAAGLRRARRARGPAARARARGCDSPMLHARPARSRAELLAARGVALMAVPVPFGQYVPVDSPVHRARRAREDRRSARRSRSRCSSSTASPGSACSRRSSSLAVRASRASRGASRCAACAPSRCLLAFTLRRARAALAARRRALVQRRAARRRRARAARRALFFVGAHRAARRRHVAADADDIAGRSSPTRSSGSCARCGASRVPVGRRRDDASIALRFIPTTAEEAERIVVAQTARGARFDEGGPVARARAYVPGARAAVRQPVPPRRRARDRDGGALLPWRRGPHAAARARDARRRLGRCSSRRLALVLAAAILLCVGEAGASDGCDATTTPHASRSPSPTTARRSPASRGSPGSTTVQGALEDALAIALRREVETVVRRPDRRGRARARAGRELRRRPATDPDAAALLRSLNALAGAGIVVREVRSARAGVLGARFDALSREYRYRLVPGPCRRCSSRACAWWVKGELDLDAMRAARRAAARRARLPVASASPSRAEGKRTRAPGRRHRDRRGGAPGRARASSCASSATRSCTRWCASIVGTLVEVGAGRRDPAWVAEALAARDRAAAGPTAPRARAHAWRVELPRGRVAVARPAASRRRERMDTPGGVCSLTLPRARR